MSEHDGDFSGVYPEHARTGQVFEASEPLGAPTPLDPDAPIHSVLEGPLVDVAFFVVLLCGAAAGALVALFIVTATAIPTATFLSSDASHSPPLVHPPVWVAALAAGVSVCCLTGLVAFPAWSRLRTDSGSHAAFALRAFAWICAVAGLGLIGTSGFALIGAFGVQPLLDTGRIDVADAALALCGFGPLTFAAYVLYALPGYLRSLARPESDENAFTPAESV